MGNAPSSPFPSPSSHSASSSSPATRASHTPTAHVREGTVVSITAGHLDLGFRDLQELPPKLLSMRPNHLTSIDLSNNALASVGGIELLHELDNIDLSHNQLPLLEVWVLSLASLEVLNVSHNCISSLPDRLFKLQKLKELKISHNQLMEVGVELTALTGLTAVNASFNAIEKIPEAIGNLVALSRLELQSNKIAKLPDTFCNLVQLQHLNLSNNQLQSIPDNFGSLKSLTKVYLDYNNISSLPPSLGNLRLREFTIRRNKLTTLPSSMDEQYLASIKNLDLAENPITDPRLQRYVQPPDVKPRSITLGASTELGLNHQTKDWSDTVVQAPQNRLYQVVEGNKGKIAAFAVLPASLHTSQAGVYVFDSRERLTVYKSKQYTERELRKAAEIVESINSDEMGGFISVYQLDFNSDDATAKQFWKDIGGKPRHSVIGYAKPQNKDMMVQEYFFQHKLLRFGEGIGGRLDIQMIAAGSQPLKKMLDSSASYVLDCSWGVFVWAGTYSSSMEKSWALLKGEELLSRGHRVIPDIMWLLDGAESAMFKVQFADWKISEESEDDGFFEEPSVGVVENKVERYEEAVLASKKDIPVSRKRTASRKSQRVKPLKPTAAAEIPERDKAEDLSVKKQSEKPHKKPLPPVAADIPRKDAVTLPHEKLEKKKPLPAVPPVVKKEEVQKEVIKEVIPSKKDDQVIEKSDVVVVPRPSTVFFCPKCNVLLSAKAPCGVCGANAVMISGDLAAKKGLFGAPTKKEEIIEAPVKPVQPKQEVVAPKPLPHVPEEEKEKPVPPPVKKEKEEIKKKESEKQFSKPLPEKPAAITPTIKQEEPKKELPKRPISPAKELPKRPISPKKEAAAPAQAPSNLFAALKRDIEKPSKDASVAHEEKAVKTEPAKEKKEGAGGHLLKSATKTKGAARKAPTKNPLRDRQARQEEHMKSSNNNNNNQKSSAGAKAVLGAHGLLRSLGLQSAQNKENDKPIYGDVVLKASGADEFTDNGIRLFHIKGRRQCVVRRVEPVVSSLNSGDVFLIDCGKIPMPLLFQWNGSQANRIEKGRAMDLAKQFRDKERPGAKLTVFEEGVGDDHFFKLLGGQRNEVASAESAGDDLQYEKQAKNDTQLYKVSPKNQKDHELVFIGASPLLKAILEIEQCYVLLCGRETYTWIGSKSGKVQRSSALILAQAKSHEYSTGWRAPVSKEYAGSEQVMFKDKFIDWGGALPIAVVQQTIVGNIASTKVQQNIDAKALLAVKAPKEEVMIDDGSGKITIWRVEEFEKVAHQTHVYGQFWSGDTYLVLYTYVWKNKECYLIYFWQGRAASINDKGASALLTINLDDELCRQAKEVRVVQNKEPKHFLTIFKSKLIVHQGRDPSVPGYQAKPTKSRLYDIRGSDDLNVRALEVDATSSALNSCHVFVLLLLDGDKKRQWIWCGLHSNSAERKFAKNILVSLDYQHIEEIQEGAEPEEFWEALGGKSEYCHPDKRYHPRIFQCTIGSGVFGVEDVVCDSLVQDDLDQEDVMLVDAGFEIWVWVGLLSAELERKMTYKLALDYSKVVSTAQPAIRPSEIPVFYLKQYQEHPRFASQFHGWQWGPKHASSWNSDPPLALVADVLAEYTRTYTYEELKNKKFPKGIDTSHLESYLSDEEFLEVFKVTKEEFDSYSLWKRETIKKELLLF